MISALYDAFYAKEELSTKYLLGTLAAMVPMARTMSEKISAARKWANGRARNASEALIVEEMHDGQGGLTFNRQTMDSFWDNLIGHFKTKSA